MFTAGVCYGAVIPLVRTILDQGYSTAEVMALQYFVGFVALAVIVLLFFRKRMPFKAFIKLLGVGVLASGVSFSYYQALSMLPAATAVTLLFQFVWMGVVVQAIRERKLPSPTIIIAMLVIMAGTVLATGILEEPAEGSLAINPLGVFFGFLSAVFYAAFLIASSKTATEFPAVNRTLFTSLGSLIVALILCPTFFTTTFAPQVTNMDFLLPSLALGILGILLPVFLIASSTPHLPGGLATIMASSELPSGILCAAIFLGDQVSWMVALGAVCILIGIALSQSGDMFAYIRRGDKKNKNTT